MRYSLLRVVNMTESSAPQPLFQNGMEIGEMAGISERTLRRRFAIEKVPPLVGYEVKASLSAGQRLSQASQGSILITPTWEVLFVCQTSYHYWAPYPNAVWHFDGYEK